MTAQNFLLWTELLTAVFVVMGAAFAAVGSFGLVRMPTFFTRIHTPTLGSTAGVWCITLATIVYFSAQGASLFSHAILITLFVALTTPVTTIFLMRATLFRERQKGANVPLEDAPAPTSPEALRASNSS